MKRLAAIGLAGLFLVGQGLLGAPAMAQQSPEPPRLRLEVSQMNPRYVTSTSTTLNIPGKITNIGDRRITKLVVRPELGERLTTERQLTETIAGGVPVTSDPPRFHPVIDTLEPGQSAPFNITVPLGSGPNALQVTKAGRAAMVCRAVTITSTTTRSESVPISLVSARACSASV